MTDFSECRVEYSCGVGKKVRSSCADFKIYFIILFDVKKIDHWVI